MGCDILLQQFQVSNGIEQANLLVGLCPIARTVWYPILFHRVGLSHYQPNQTRLSPGQSPQLKFLYYSPTVFDI